MSYDQRANTLGKIIQTLSGQMNYQPFETDLQVGTLGILMQDLLNKNRGCNGFGYC